jgi:hypothetical protein
MVATAMRDTLGPAVPRLATVLALFVCILGGASAGAQTLPAVAPRPPANAEAMPNIAFYLARGEADACGRGCSEWIAAEGKFDLDAPLRLRRLLAGLGGRRPPIYFHSVGGTVVAGMAVGRLIREHHLEVSVGYTIPSGCDHDRPFEKSCEAIKQSGRELEAELDPTQTVCNSSCVWALVGGSVRLVPPGAALGIHDVGLDQAVRPPPGISLDKLKEAIHARLRQYLRDMGIDEALLTATLAIPFERARFLERDELVRFGIDRREHGETGWQLVNKPAPVLRTGFFARAASQEQRYESGYMSLGCAGPSVLLILAYQHIAPAPAGPAPRPTVRMGVELPPIELPIRISSGAQDVGIATLPATRFDAVGDNATIEISWMNPGRDEAAADRAALSMDGFATAYAKLRKRCDELPRTAAFTMTLPGQPAAGPVANSATSGTPQPSTRPGQPQLNTPSGRPQLSTWSFPVNPTAAPVWPAPSNPALPTRAAELTRVATFGQKVRLDFLYSIGPDCSPAGQISVRIREPPSSGEVTIENGQGSTNFLQDTPEFACNSRVSDGTVVFYQTRLRYGGVDSLTLDVTDPQGTVSSRHYSIVVGK